MSANLAGFLYLIAGVCFILALRGLSHPASARRGVTLGIAGMALAIVTTFALPQVNSYVLPVLLLLAGGAVGAVIAKSIKMTALPQLIAIFHSFVGLAATFVALAAFYDPQAMGIGTADAINSTSRFELGLGGAIGAITFSGSLVAFGKLQGILGSSPVQFRMQHLINLAISLVILALLAIFTGWQSEPVLLLLLALSFLIGLLVIIPIGGADMPVVISMLNSYSGWAACGIGFTLANPGLIITGALVGASGAILSYIMCKGMNRSIVSVVLGGFGATAEQAAAGSSTDAPVNSGSAVDAAFMLKNAQNVIIVPGYGLAVAQAQFALQELCALMKEDGINVRFAIHPVAGRMPGHMNVLLAEAGVSYDDVKELEDINREFGDADVSLVIGANDVTNPTAKTDKTSQIYGMPVLDVEKSHKILFVKRSMASGYAGVANPLFFNSKTVMLFGDAKAVCEDMIKAYES